MDTDVVSDISVLCLVMQWPAPPEFAFNSSTYVRSALPIALHESIVQFFFWGGDALVDSKGQMCWSL